MSRCFVGFAAVLLSNLASAEPMSLTPLDPDDGQTPPTVVTAQLQQQAPPDRGFFEQLFGNGAPSSRRGSQQWYGPPPEDDCPCGSHRQATRCHRANDGSWIAESPPIRVEPDGIVRGAPTGTGRLAVSGLRPDSRSSTTSTAVFLGRRTPDLQLASARPAE